mgnify:CR=1 FL=1
MAAPVNQDPATAIEFGPLPASVSQNVHDAGTTYTVWYKYTTVVTDKVIGVWGFGDLVTYTPGVLVYEGLSNANAGIEYIDDPTGVISVTNKPIQLPVTYPNVYYFKFVKNGLNPTPAVLLLEAEHAPNDDIAVGSVLINDETINFPAVVLSGSTGAPIQFFRPFSSGDYGAVLPYPSGKVLLSNDDLFTVSLYSNQLVLLITVNPFSGSDSIAICCNQVDTFYVCDQTTGAVKSINDLGVVGGTSWQITGLTARIRAIAVSNDETILYYVQNLANTPIQRWNLVTDLAMSDLVAGVASHFPISELLVLADNSIVAGYQKNTAVVNYQAINYSAAGAVVHTYAFGTTRLSRMAYAIDDPNSFWVWMFPSPTGTSRFDNIKISDGSTLSSFTGIQFDLGGNAAAVSATPTRFGHSSSCSFYMLRIVSNIGSGIYIVIPDKTYDELYSEDVNIPDPTVKTGLIGS